MTLNDLERRNELFSFFLPNSIVLLANYVKVSSSSTIGYK